MRRYESFEDLSGVIECGRESSGKTAKQYGNSSDLLRYLIEEASPGFSYAVLTQISSDVITDGRTEKAREAKRENNLESWLGKPKNLSQPARPLTPSEIEFIEKRLKEIKEMGLPRGQGPQACWLANYALQQDLGELLADPRAEDLPLYCNIPWTKLPSWK